MNKHLIRSSFFFFIITLPLLAFYIHCEPYDPEALFLTWQEDPTTTMTISWISEQTYKDDVIEFKKAGEETWRAAQGKHFPLPEELPYLLHRVNITSLEPNNDYIFKIGSDAVEHKFRTLPNDPNATFRFLVGGDMYNGKMKRFQQMNEIAAACNPMFVLIGGDIAYAHAKYPERDKPKKKMRWIQWMTAWKEQMVTPEGCLIPLVPAIGNHDVTGWFDQTPEQSPFFYTFFPMPGPQGYNVLDIANFISIFILDSDHTHLIIGAQELWLNNALKQRQHIPHKFALYHFPAFPSVRNIKDVKSASLRRHWVPIFERFGLTAAFEHHEHAYKRTHPILDNQVNPKGILYLGDGGWAVSNIRTPRKPETTWHLAQTAAEQHFILVTIQGGKRIFRAINSKGELFDEVESSLLENQNK